MTQEEAQVDYLTGFYSRESLDAYLMELMRDTAIDKKSFSIALIDLDRFKEFNDRFGHSFGDEILKYTSNMIRLTLINEKMRPFRYGGDEFVLIFSEKKPQEAARLLQKCGSYMRYRLFLHNNKFHKIRITMSCGIVGFPDDGRTAEDLVGKADKAMYFSKRSGRNKITLARNLKYLKLRNTLVIACVIFFIASFSLKYQAVFKEVSQIILKHVKGMRIVTKPPSRELDRVVLKNGRTIEGRIVKETRQDVVITLYLEKGEGTTRFYKSEVVKIEYAPKKHD